MELVPVPIQVVQDLFRHLASRPWAEANDLIVALQRCLPAPEPAPVPKDEKPKPARKA
jgi:hypothetical protein